MSRIIKIQIDDGPELDCTGPDDLSIHQGDRCVAKVGDVLEIGQVLEFRDAGNLNPGAVEKLPLVLRCATLQDQSKAAENVLRSKMARETCATMAEKQGLAIRLVSVRYSFNREMLMVQFTADESVDPRGMVKELAAELRTRVDVRQIGVRDEAAIIGGMGPCGRALCCCSWLNHFESVNVRMAKAQAISLNPASMSGMCGRLKCCLRYEYEQYRELSRNMPRDGAYVECPHGCGRVFARNILAQRVKVRLDDDRIAEYGADEVHRTRQKRRGPDEDTRRKRPEPRAPRKT